MTSPYGPQGFRECLGDYRAEADLEQPSQPLYRFQRALPRLPVPKLADTVALYLETLAPLVSPEELAVSTRLARAFLSPGGAGEELQRRLAARAAERGDSSFLAEWWNTLGYLQVRDPVVFNVSYFFHFADSAHREQRSSAGRAAALLRGAMEFRGLVASGQLEPEQLGRDKTPVCATAYKYMFNACRVPRRGSDTYRIYDPARHNHVVVLRRGRFFRLEMLNTHGGVLSFQQLRAQLERVIALADAPESADVPPVGALTAEDRDTWADAREELLRAHEGNAETLQAIESAVLVLNLDAQAPPVARAEVARALWHGDGRNRWFDKCVQLMVFENGKAGLLGEHSMLDGMPMARFADFVLTRLANRQVAMGRDHAPPTAPVAELRFHVSAGTARAIRQAEETFDATAADHEVHVESFRGFGSRAIKQMRCSPDAFVQLAIQLAYKKLFGKAAATYEASQTRVFLHGRTETTRSCSAQSAAFTAAMAPDSDTSADDKRALLLAAANAHVRYMRRAGQGLGVDRHLLALRLLVRPGESVPFLEDPAMSTSRYWLVSTSHLTNERFDGWGWGEVVPEGLGIAYSIKNHAVQFNIACRQHGGWAAKMGHLLEESLVEMQQLFPAGDSGAKPPAKL